MDQLRYADAKIAGVAHPRQRSKWRLNRYNPKVRWNMKKHRVTHPLEHEKWKLRSKLNYINPLFYIRRIKNNIRTIIHR